MQTVYQVSWFSLAPEMLPGLYFVVFGMLLFRPRVFVGQQRQQIKYALRFLAPGLFLAVGIFLIGGVVVEGHQNIKSLRAGQCRVVEGMVTVLEVGWPSGHGHDERIRIGADEFEYSANNRTNYHWFVREGGPLTNGSYARLHVFDGQILKVEIKR